MHIRSSRATYSKLERLHRAAQHSTAQSSPVQDNVIKKEEVGKKNKQGTTGMIPPDDLLRRLGNLTPAELKTRSN
jgi:hypothetical protein